MENMNEKQVLEARLKKLGFTKTINVGLNILELKAGSTYILKIDSGFNDFMKKDGKVFKYLECTDLETGETGNIWVGGQLRYQLETMKDGFIGGVFAITYKGLVDVNGEEMHQYDIKAVN